MSLRYILGATIAIPLLPVMFFQGKRIRKSVPQLPEAIEPAGEVNLGSKQDLNIIFIGESTIAGVGVKTHDEGFAGTFSKTLAELTQSNVKWKVYARSGYTAQLVTQRLLPKIEENEVDLVVIGLGGNDAFTLNTPWGWRANMSELIEQAQQRLPNTPIAFTNMPPIKSFPAFTSLIKFTVGNLVEILGDELEKVVSHKENTFYYSRKITLEDWIERFGLNMEPSKFFSDGVHPAKITYQVWAKDFANFLFNEKIFATQNR